MEVLLFWVSTRTASHPACAHGVEQETSSLKLDCSAESNSCDSEIQTVSVCVRARPGGAFLQICPKPPPSEEEAALGAWIFCIMEMAPLLDEREMVSGPGSDHGGRRVKEVPCRILTHRRSRAAD